MNSDQKYLTDRYIHRIERLAESHTAIPLEEVKDIYLQECEHFEEFLRNDTPSSTIRRIAFVQTEKVVREVQNERGDP